MRSQRSKSSPSTGSVPDPGGYREYPAPAALASHVACLWSRSGCATVIVPDGCADLIWTDERVIVAGPATRGFVSGQPPAGRSYVGVRLRVGAAGGVLGVPAHELLDDSPVVGDLWPEVGDLAGRCAEAGGVPAMIEVLVDSIGPRVRDAQPVDPVVAGAIHGLAGPRARVDRLDVGLSTRQLRRRFELAVGYPPKTLARILRLQRFLSAGGTAGALADLAQDLGYTDHAHLSRDCRELTGSTPTQLLAAGVPATGEPRFRRSAQSYAI